MIRFFEQIKKNEIDELTKSMIDDYDFKQHKVVYCETSSETDDGSIYILLKDKEYIKINSYEDEYRIKSSRNINHDGLCKYIAKRFGEEYIEHLLECKYGYSSEIHIHETKIDALKKEKETKKKEFIRKYLKG